MKKVHFLDTVLCLVAYSSLVQMELFVLSNFDHSSFSSLGVVHVYLKDVDVERRIGVDLAFVRQSVQVTNLSHHSIRSIVQYMDNIMEAVKLVAVKVSLCTIFPSKIIQTVCPQIQAYVYLVLHIATALYTVSPLLLRTICCISAECTCTGCFASQQCRWNNRGYGSNYGGSI